MHRFYLPPEQARGQPLLLTGGEAHHALQVLRLREGNRLEVLNGVGRRLLCQVAGCSRKEVTLQILEVAEQSEPPVRITLLQAIPKGKNFESVIQKATELGVSRIVPVLSERVVSQLDDRDHAPKVQKWQATAIEAIKQCGQAWLPQVSPPVSIAGFLQRGESFDLPLIASLHPGRKHLRHYLRSHETAGAATLKSACVWIGPEGDFTPEEVDAITAAGALPITLGSLVLRVETAAICALSILAYELRLVADRAGD